MVTEVDHHDICIIGAGVIGLAVAHKITAHSAFKNKTVVLLEQHRQFGQETSSRNSEVIHAGIYYPAGSLKASMCVSGREQLYHYCETHQVPFRKTGKLIIAGKSQEQALHKIYQQALANGVKNLESISARQIKRKEPLIQADYALFSPESGIVNSHAYMQSLLHQAEKAGLIFAPLTRALMIERHANGFLVESQCQDSVYQFTCSQLVNAAGLNAQEVATKICAFPESEIPTQALVKGSYFTLQGKSPFHHLIYPVPEKNLKGLGIHVTLDMAGQVKFGPDTEALTTIDYSIDPGNEEKFRKAIAQYYPAISEHILQPAYSGIRPKLISKNGAADFVIQNGKAFAYDGLVQLFGIESPGLTASLAIGDAVTEILCQ
ncbi:MAG: NAD(P)/FAD-dependent oxidoreductase [Gammaproteobacteria bacterium]|nr:NAD(P)/FAD-dependent oxidoreductase [Gammaproteobacteria bacterium]